MESKKDEKEFLTGEINGQEVNFSEAEVEKLFELIEDKANSGDKGSQIIHLLIQEMDKMATSLDQLHTAIHTLDDGIKDMDDIHTDSIGTVQGAVGTLLRLVHGETLESMMAEALQQILGALEE